MAPLSRTAGTVSHARIQILAARVPRRRANRLAACLLGEHQAIREIELSDFRSRIVSGPVFPARGVLGLEGWLLHPPG